MCVCGLTALGMMHTQELDFVLLCHWSKCAMVSRRTSSSSNNPYQQAWTGCKADIEYLNHDRTFTKLSFRFQQYQRPRDRLSLSNMTTSPPNFVQWLLRTYSKNKLLAGNNGHHVTWKIDFPQRSSRFQKDEEMLSELIKSGSNIVWIFSNYSYGRMRDS